MKSAVLVLTVAGAVLLSPGAVAAQDDYFWEDEAELALDVCMRFVNDPRLRLDGIADAMAEEAEYDDLGFRSIQREDDPAPPSPYLRTSVLWDRDPDDSGAAGGSMVLKDEGAGVPDTHSVLCIFSDPDQPTAEFDARLTAALEAAARAWPAGGQWVSLPPGPGLSATWRRTGVHVVGGRSYPIEIEVSRFTSVNMLRARRIQPVGMPR